MPAATHRLEFAPPPPPGWGRAWGLALLAHLLLVAALTWGISWRHDDTHLAAEAELWSAQVQQAAPPLQEAPPPPPPPPAAVAPAPPPPAPREADIALEREKKRVEQEKKKQEAEKAQAQKKAEAEKKRLDDQKKREAQEKAAQEQAQARARDEAEAKRAEAQRQENLRRIQGLAGATGAENATGNATRSSGPSDSYAGRIRARIKPNIVFMDDVPGNPVAEVEVRMAPDGTIVSRRITKASGAKAWDEAVLRALDRTAVLPRDTDGRVHSPLILTFRPRD